MRAQQRTGTGVWHWKHVRPHDPALKPIGQWLPANRGFYDGFRDWLVQAGYGEVTLNLYSLAARLALAVLDKPYWTLEAETDFSRVRRYLGLRYPKPETQAAYRKGLAKFEEYWCTVCRHPEPAKEIHWSYYLHGLPGGVREDLKRWVVHRRRSWRPDAVYHSTLGLLSPLTRPLRWIAEHHKLQSTHDVTPARWFEYVDSRLATGIQPVTLNGEWGCLKEWLRFLAEEGASVHPRVLEIEPLKAPGLLPRDLPVQELRRLLQAIGREASSKHANLRRMGVMDRAWFLLMLHSGLRTGEVRRLCLSDLDVKERRVRIEQSKGLKDRLVCLSPVAVEALQKYLKIRGPAAPDVEQVFLYRHRPLSRSYIGERLHTYGRRCGVRATPHQLRHSCATLLLNAGAPVLTVQTILGHQHVDTTLGHVRLYDGTVAADYYRAMAQVEQRFAADPDCAPPAPNAGELIALVDALRTGTLSARQQQVVRALRDGIMAAASASGTKA